MFTVHSWHGNFYQVKRSLWLKYSLRIHKNCGLFHFTKYERYTVFKLSVNSVCNIPLNILRTKRWTVTQISVCLGPWRGIIQIQVRIIKGHFLTIYYRVMALVWRPKFASAQYLEKDMKFDKILHMHWHLQDQGWNCRNVVCQFISRLWQLIDARILFPGNIPKTDWWFVTKFCLCVFRNKI